MSNEKTLMQNFFKKNFRLNINYNPKNDKHSNSESSLAIFENRDYLTKYPDKTENQKRKNFPFDKDSSNWEIEIFHNDNRCMQGFRYVYPLNNEKVEDYLNYESKDYITIEFIHSHYKVTKNKPFRWGSKFYYNMTSSQMKKVDNVIPKIYDAVRRLQKFKKEI